MRQLFFGSCIFRNNLVKYQQQSNGYPYEKLKKEVWIRSFVLGGIFIVLGLLFVFRGKDVNRNVITEIMETSASDETDTSSKTIFVYVTGAVLSPGVYELPEGSRMTALIDASGGFTEDAGTESLNLAEFLYDGMHVHVPRVSEETIQFSDGKINLNSATVEELTTLSGIGEAKAKAIIAYREKNGYFKRPEDVKNVSGIGDSLYERIAEDITVR